MERSRVLTITTALLAFSLILAGGFGIAVNPNFGVALAQSGGLTLSAIAPARVVAGDPGFTLIVTGSGFKASDVVTLDDSDLATRFVSSTRLLATVPASALAGAGTKNIKVKPASGDPTASVSLTIEQKSASLTITKIRPTPVSIGSSSFDLRVRGTGFANDSKVLIGGSEAPVQPKLKNNELRLIATVNADLLKASASLPVQVLNADSTLSNLFTLVVTPPDQAPAIVSISPSQVDAGKPGFTLTINGGPFDAGAQAFADETTLETLSVTTTQMTANVPASVISEIKQVKITAKNPDGRVSNAVTLNIVKAVPRLFSVAPNQAFAGGPNITVHLNGENFRDDSKVLINGLLDSRISVTRFSENVLRVILAPELRASPGKFTIQVANTDSQTNEDDLSSIFEFNVREPFQVSTFAGSGFVGLSNGNLSEVRFTAPSRMTTGPDGNIYITDQLNHAVRRLDPRTGNVITLAGNGTPGLVNGTVSTDVIAGPPALNPIRLNNPAGIAVDSKGVIYVTELGNNIIRRLTPQIDGSIIVDVLAGEVKPSESNANVLVGVAGFKDGTGNEAQFNKPDGIVVARNGNIYLADANNNRIRTIKINTDGTVEVSTLAGKDPGNVDEVGENARFNTPTGITIDENNTFLYVVDTNNLSIRRVEIATGSVFTVYASASSAIPIDGGPGSGLLMRPTGLALGKDGIIFVSDTFVPDAFSPTQVFVQAIRMVNTNDGSIATLAGSLAERGYVDGSAFNARFSNPRDLLLTSDGKFIVVDQVNNRLRMVSPPPTP